MRLDALRPVIERVSRSATTAWYSLSEERREWLLKRRRRLLWWAAVGLGLWLPPLLVLVAAAAYVLQSPPRRASSPILLTVCAALPVLWIRNAAADLGLLDDASELSIAASAVLAIAAAVAAARLDAVFADGATGVRPLLPWLRRGIDPRAYGIPPFRVLLGYKGRAWVTAPRQVGTLVIGPPRSGKTSGVIIPNVLAWTGPVVITSTRRDVLDACHGIRSQRGTVWCFDPVGIVASTMPATVNRLDWSPLRGAETFDTALTRARALLAGAADGTEGRDHWRARGTQLLAALLHAAVLAQRPMSTVIEWTHAGRLDAAEHVCTQTRARQAAAILRGIAQTPDRERGSIWSALAGGLASFDDSIVLASADRAASCSFGADTFLSQPDSLFIVAPSDESTPLAPLVVGLVEEIRAEALRQSNATGALALPLLLALDEIASICPLPSLPQIAAEGGGRNVILLAILQDLSQAAARWGRDVADGLLTFAGAKLVLPGLADTETLQRLETLIGKHWVEQVSRSDTQNGFLFGDRTWGKYRSEIELPRIPATRVRQLLPGHAMALCGRDDARVIRLMSTTMLPVMIRRNG
ncbi:MAG TPA: type IV secretory system conjugative DNA transfer family protein [Candidatus Angelobacter sp.]|jgi:type IV secretion system protein VirD4|nr:type IV secretory system conjugative DNA transfer family protein [Candidatus Angelobacter sp.]